MPSIVDVAAAGVSKAIVSRVLNTSPYLWVETRQHVERAIARLGFRPGRVARSLTSRRTRTAGLLTSDVGSPFHADVLHGAAGRGIDCGYCVFLSNTNYDPQRGQMLIRSLIDWRVDDVSIVSSRMSDAWFAELTHQRVTAAVVDWNIRAALRLLDRVRPPTAIFAASDRMAMGVLVGARALIRHCHGSLD